MVRLESRLLIPILIASLLTGNGCSMLIASSGVSHLPTFAMGSTRQEVRQTLGDPESSEARSDGTRLETYRIRRKVKSAWGDFWKGPIAPGGGGEAMAYILMVATAVGLGFEVYATGKAIADSEKQKYQVALIYGPDDRLLVFYDVNAPPAERFAAVRHPLAELQWKQLENDECPSWSACVTPYVDELRRRATLVGYTLDATDEEKLQRLLEVARDRDEGRITKGQGLIGIAGQGRTPKELREALQRGLEADWCPSWVACVTFYVDEARRWWPVRLGTSRYLEIARGKDEDRITKEDALAQLRQELP